MCVDAVPQNVHEGTLMVCPVILVIHHAAARSLPLYAVQPDGRDRYQGRSQLLGSLYNQATSLIQLA